MLDYTNLILSGITFLIGLTTGLVFFKTNSTQKLKKAEKKAQIILNETEQTCLHLINQSKEQKSKYEQLISEYEIRYQQFSQRLECSINFLEQKTEERENQQKQLQEHLTSEELVINTLQSQIESIKAEILPKLATRLSTSIENIKQEILRELENDCQYINDIKLKKQEEYLKEESVQLAKNYLIEAIQRYAASTSVKKPSFLIPISRDETRLKLMGKNLEILNFIEEATGCDILFENNKKGITVSHFQLVQRHIARETLIKLMKDRVVNLEKVKARLLEASNETRMLLIAIGDKVISKLDLVHRKFPNDFKEILGRLKYRTSYGQNILKHCFEVGYFTLILGNELGLNEEICKIGGFFHDLGKAIDQEDGRPHDVLTKEIMEKFAIFSWEEIHAAWTHHDAMPIETPEALLVKAADAISAGRPGARQETIEKYLARISAIEKIANSYQGVTKSYAISGGHELRVIVNHKDLNDENLPELAHTIAGEIESNIAYPGQIKVNVIRKIQYYRTAKEKK